MDTTQDTTEINVFPYSWHIKDQEIHAYTFTEDNKICLVRILNFTPYLYVKLPDHIDWDISKRGRLVNIFKKNCRIQNIAFRYKKPLYYSCYKQTIEHETREVLSPYFFISFATDKDRKNFTYYVKKKQHIIGIDEEINLEFYEYNASPILQMTVCREISTADWFTLKSPIIKPECKISNCDYEFCISYKNIFPIDIPNSNIPKPLVMSWDIETYSHDPNIVPDGKHQLDIVFQISCVVGKVNDDGKIDKYLLTLGDPDESNLVGINVLRFKSEIKLLLGFRDLINNLSPQILIGYNIFRFDIPMLYERSCLHYISGDFVRQGYTNEKCKKETIKWSSSAYSNQEMNFFDLQGRITIDLLTLIQRDYNLESYKLNFVAEKFLNAKKDPLTHIDIFTCYSKGIKEENSKALGIVGKYCVKDSLLVFELFQKFQYWYSLIEMSKICQVPYAHLFLYGQQLKVFSQVYKFCYNQNFVVESGFYKPSSTDYCAGAYVFPPKSGLYNNVVSFDFASLYPSIIMSHNIDFSTLVVDENIPDEKCHVIEWPEHINCTCEDMTEDKEYDGIICKNYKFRWLKEPKGILPSIIQNLLSARKSVRNQMKNFDKNSLQWSILNNRQLAYKVSANSMYGILPTKVGYLPFLPAGMCVTAVGRQSISKVSEIINTEYKGEVIYGDTDSNYVIFPHIKTLDKLWDYCHKVSDEVSMHFPPPMRLEFEDCIYSRYLILSKKRYLYYSITPDGKTSDVINNKGVLLKRRDNSKIIRTIYENIIRMILNNNDEQNVLNKLLEWIIILYTKGIPSTDFQISKSIKEIQNFQISEKSAKKIKFGDYVVPKLSENPDEKLVQLNEKGVTTDYDFYISHLPGPVKLALKMRSRGQQIESGSRLSFVVTKFSNVKNIGERIEEIDYFLKYYKKHWIDSLHYLHLLTKPIEEVLCIIYGKKYNNFISDICKRFKLYDKTVNEMRRVFYPIIIEGHIEQKVIIPKKKSTSKKMKNK